MSRWRNRFGQIVFWIETGNHPLIVSYGMSPRDRKIQPWLLAGIVSCRSWAVSVKLLWCMLLKVRYRWIIVRNICVTSNLEKKNDKRIWNMWFWICIFNCIMISCFVRFYCYRYFDIMLSYTSESLWQRHSENISAIEYYCDGSVLKSWSEHKIRGTVHMIKCLSTQGNYQLK